MIVREIFGRELFSDELLEYGDWLDELMVILELVLRKYTQLNKTLMNSSN